MSKNTKPLKVAIIGGGPAGLMAAQIISQNNIEVHLFDRMPTVGRKLLLAGIGGLNITHSEDTLAFNQRYIPESYLTPYLQQFSAQEVIQWCSDLGIETFTGSSGRIFPKEMKAAPLLRTWIKLLKDQGVCFHTKHVWKGWDSNQQLVFEHLNTPIEFIPNATLLALGGASYPRLGSDGTWSDYLQSLNIECSPWQPANCGFELPTWSDYFKNHFAGSPLKSITCSFTDYQGTLHSKRGELLISHYGIEGSLCYALSAFIRDTLTQQGHAILSIDLLPHYSLAMLQQKLSKPRGHQSLSNFLRKQINLTGVKIALIRELVPNALQDMNLLATTLKALPLNIKKPRPIAEAISSAGGVCINELTTQLSLKKQPSVFCAGEMIDWEAPTGGYLLTGCLSTGYTAGHSIVKYLLEK